MRSCYVERDVLEARGVLAEGLKLGHLALFELAEEARVLTPEEPDVRDVEKNHADALKSDAAGPADVLVGVDVSVAEDVFVDDTRAEDFHPVVLEVDLEFVGRLGEGEEVWVPARGEVAVAQDELEEVDVRLFEVVDHQSPD